jgi:hypothetical protein
MKRSSIDPALRATRKIPGSVSLCFTSAYLHHVQSPHHGIYTVLVGNLGTSSDTTELLSLPVLGEVIFTHSERTPALCSGIRKDTNS